jgi:hypothetical protein
MLIDVSRRPIRIIWEECSDVVVIRTMRIRALCDGLIHQEATRLNSLGSRTVTNTITPSATLLQQDYEYLESILWDPKHLLKLLTRTRDYRYRREVLGDNEIDENAPYYTVSGLVDQFTKIRNVWRINLILNDGPKGTRLLTLTEETGLSLFTIQMPPVGEKGIFKVVTPLLRYVLKSQQPAARGLFQALLEDDEDEDGMG